MGCLLVIYVFNIRFCNMRVTSRRKFGFDKMLKMTKFEK